jgi:hypothetical protein
MYKKNLNIINYVYYIPNNGLSTISHSISNKSKSSFLVISNKSKSSFLNYLVDTF